MQIEIECPYCGEENKIDSELWPDGGDGKSTDYECVHCGKKFMITLEVSYGLNASKADCLNGAPHNLRIDKTESLGELLVWETCRECGYEKLTVQQKGKLFK